jgi:signal transduction histidine kinase
MPISLQLGLKTALDDFSAQFPNVRFHFFGKEKRIDERIEFVVYCCANELVNNSVQQSGAQNIDIQLVQGDDYITFTVEDDGCGFDDNSATKGMGLKSIRDRVASCGGKMDVVTSQGKGTETTIEIKIK